MAYEETSPHPYDPPAVATTLPPSPLWGQERTFTTNTPLKQAHVHRRSLTTAASGHGVHTTHQRHRQTADDISRSTSRCVCTETRGAWAVHRRTPSDIISDHDTPIQLTSEIPKMKKVQDARVQAPRERHDMCKGGADQKRSDCD